MCPWPHHVFMLVVFLLLTGYNVDNHFHPNVLLNDGRFAPRWLSSASSINLQSSLTQSITDIHHADERSPASTQKQHMAFVNMCLTLFNIISSDTTWFLQMIEYHFMDESYSIFCKIQILFIQSLLIRIYIDSTC